MPTHGHYVGTQRKRALQNLAVHKKLCSRRRKQHLLAQMELKLQEEAAAVDRWLNMFDTNKNRRLERHELALLLRDLEPTHTPTQAALDYVWTSATKLRKAHADTRKRGRPESDDNGDGEGPEEDGLDRDELRGIVLKYREYGKQSEFIDEVMARFDVDGSGALESSPAEIKAFLKAILEGTLSVQGDEHAVQSTARTFKLQSIKAAYHKGLLSDNSMRNKWEKVTGIKPPPNRTDRLAHSAPVLPSDFEVTDGDVEFVLQVCDRNGDGAINRDEILASISVWTSLISEAIMPGSPRCQPGCERSITGSKFTELQTADSSPGYTPPLGADDDPTSKACSIM